MTPSKRPISLFGTDGIRGIANMHPMVPEILIRVGQALVTLLKEVYPGDDIRIVIGRDTRISGPMIEDALAAGICSQGGGLYLVGELPTPGIAFITTAQRAHAGIVISASHNLYRDNGVKIFSSDGFKISDEWENKIETFVESASFAFESPREVKKIKLIKDSAGRYIEFLKNSFPKHLTLKGLKIILDCAHGAAYEVGPAVFEELGGAVEVIHGEPNGMNINDQCGSTAPEKLSRRVLETGADLGIAWDGDADRIIAVDEKGIVRDGDYLMAIIGLSLHEKKRLSKETVVSTQMSNFGLERALKSGHIHLIRTDVGDRFVVEEMRKHHYNFGGEQSGHLIFLDYSTTGDGILSALHLVSIIQEKQRSLSELSKVVQKIPQILLNVKVKEKKPFETLANTSAKMKEIEKFLSGRGRLLVRYSGTENLARVMIEGENEMEIEKFAYDLAESLRGEIS